MKKHPKEAGMPLWGVLVLSSYQNAFYLLMICLTCLIKSSYSLTKDG